MQKWKPNVEIEPLARPLKVAAAQIRGWRMPRIADAPATTLADAATRKRRSPVTAVLGSTNTGKTHYAVERMLGHKSGVIGFPLRLLAREVYDRICNRIGEREVGLITGEEKILPPNTRFILSTVEAMPLDWDADFLAVDEIQLAEDPERGHVFTDRLLHARGRIETLFLGATTMGGRIKSLIPDVQFMMRDRFSKLSYAGSKKLSRMPARSAIVAFSVDNVYALAELLRRQKGGAAVVMGALSPRTRNAQVALYQEGDVDFLVATDAIGMGLNMDVRHVAFAGLSKFDGRRMRRLWPSELAQIAGRAGRHTNDGTFGVTGEAVGIEPEVVQSIEAHRFSPVGRLQWRNSNLEFTSLNALIRSLEREPPNADLARAREADDLGALRRLATDPDIAERANGRAALRILWDVCQIPDFRKTMPTDHAALLSQIYGFLTAEAGVVPESWMAQAVARVDRIDGDIDTLSKRLASVRTWTYVANRNDWLAGPAHWRGVTREVEDKLSDALHARLIQRFVDRRTSVLARRLKQKEKLVATIEANGAVSVEGEFVGTLEGFRFQPDPAAVGAEVKTLQTASAQALAAEIARRVEKFYSSSDAEIDLTEQGGLMWGDVAVGRLQKNGGPAADQLAVQTVAFVDQGMDANLREKVERRLQFWIDRKIAAAFEPLIAMRDDMALTGIARGVAFRLVERLGVIPRHEISNDIRALEQVDRGMLRKHGVRFGQYTIFMPALLKPAPTRLRIILWGLAEALDVIPSPPPPGSVTMQADNTLSATYYQMAGYRACGERALRLDMLERLADMIRPLDQKAGFEASPEMLSITGATLEQFVGIMGAFGFRAEKGDRPKTAKPQAKSRKAVKTETETEADAVKATGDGMKQNPAIIFQAEARPDVEAKADVAAAAVETVAIPPLRDDATQKDSMVVDGKPDSLPKTTVIVAASDESAVDAAAASETDAAASATDEVASATDEAASATATDSTIASEIVAAEPEREIFYIFSRVPKPRRRDQGGGQEKRGEPRGNFQKHAGKNERGSGQRRADGGKQGTKGGKRRDGDGDVRAKTAFVSSPRREAKLDPDSPFAVLQRLKDQG